MNGNRQTTANDRRHAPRVSREQANLPGTTDAHPNWRRRLSAPLDELLAGAEMMRTAALVADLRRRAAGQQ